MSGDALLAEVERRIEANYLGPDSGRLYDGREAPDAALRNAYDEGLEAAVRIVREVRAEGTTPTPFLCSQCGEQPSAMVKIGTADGWCVTCLDEAADTPRLAEVERRIKERVALCREQGGEYATAYADGLESAAAEVRAGEG